MDEIRTGKHFDRLSKRRDELLVTLRHLDNEQHQVEENTDWLDQAAYESRVKLLDRLSGWYLTEMAEIENALERIKTHKYGICLACHEPIEATRLERLPEAACCSACQELREGLESFDDRARQGSGFNLK
ncbi:MAG TPA: TraR/DksA family transcriptional regulator [Acidobacteriota bacterium]|nr:TraR/DksA family transcriptional regulator [Acidobacteriota bacterium]